MNGKINVAAGGKPRPPSPHKGGTWALQNYSSFLKHKLYPYIMKSMNLHDVSTVSPPVGEGGGGIEILVFKTNLANARHIKKIGSSLNLHPHIKEWNVDLHDCDKILRVVAERIAATDVEQIVFSAGHFCEELK